MYTLDPFSPTHARQKETTTKWASGLAHGFDHRWSLQDLAADEWLPRKTGFMGVVHHTDPKHSQQC